MDFNVISPKGTDELLKTIQEYQTQNFRFGAGYTDLILDLKTQPVADLTVINLVNLEDKTFTSIDNGSEGIRIGSLVTAATIIENNILKKEYHVLWKAANSLASGQIRKMATIGGNLCTGSPAGDLSCSLVALRAKCEVLSTDKSIKTIPVEDFFTGVKKICLKKNEVLRSIFIPLNNPNGNIYSDFIKVGTRRSMEIATVSLAYNILTDSNNKIVNSGISCGSVSPTIKFAKSACDYLKDKNFSEITKTESEEFAKKVLENVSPISDFRASKWYRSKVLVNISKSIFNH